jgi:hypothetical protein
MQIVRESRMRARILTAIAKDDLKMKNQLLYVAEKWLALAILREQLLANADRKPDKPHSRQ